MSSDRSDADGQDAGKFGVEGGLALLKYERDGFDEIGVEFVESIALCAGAGETGDLADIDASVGASFDDGCERAHGRTNGHDTGAGNAIARERTMSSPRTARSTRVESRIAGSAPPVGAPA